MLDFQTSQIFTRRYLCLVASLLWLLLAGVNADAGFGDKRWANAASWMLQIPVGLFLLLALWRWLLQQTQALYWPVLAILLLSAVLASVIAAPVYVLIEYFVALVMAAPFTVPMAQGVSFWITETVQEWTFLVLPFMAAWLLITLPMLHRLSPLEINSLKPEKRSEPEPLHIPLSAPGIVEAPEASSIMLQAPILLPVKIQGRWLAVRSELQYLRVWTDKGSGLVLGSLQEVEDFFGADGIRVHRSWWVARNAKADTQLIAKADNVNLSNGLCVPISRRRKDAVLRYFDAP